MIKVGGMGKLFSIMYTDKLSVNRRVEVEQPDRTTKVILPDVPLLSDVPCRISYSNEDNAETNKEDSNPRYLLIRAFLDPAVHIKKGDNIVADRIDDSGVVLATYTGVANEPKVYTTHQEVEFVQTGDA